MLLARPDGAADEAGLIELPGWVREHLGRWSNHPRAADLKVESAQAHLLVRVHAPLLAQAVDNLLENALNYSTPGTPVLVRVSAEGSLATLEIEDHGCGLERGELAQVFEPFFRSEQARLGGQPGVGLGLAIAQRIAATLGGTIAVTSEPGIGSRFVLRLPLVTG